MITCLLWFVTSFLFLDPTHLKSQVMTIEIENVQLAHSLGAKVHDSSGSPMAGVLVEELSPDWKVSLRSTKTDAAGAFTFVPVKGREIYYLQLTFKNFNALRVRVKVNRQRGKDLQLQMEVST